MWGGNAMLFNTSKNKCKISDISNFEEAGFASLCWDKGVMEEVIHGKIGTVRNMVYEMVTSGKTSLTITIFETRETNTWFYKILYFQNMKIGCVIISVCSDLSCAEFLFMYLEDSFRNRGLGSIYQKKIEDMLIMSMPQLKEFKIRCFKKSLAGQAVAEKMRYKCISTSSSGIKDYRKPITNLKRIVTRFKYLIARQ